MRAFAILGSLALAATAHAEDSPQDVKARRAVLAAIEQGDAQAFGAQIHKFPLRLYHVWFDDPACAKELGGKVARAKVPRLVRCLAQLGLKERADGAFVAAPGVAIVPLWFRGKLAGLSGVKVEAGAPTVTDAAIAEHLISGSLDVPPDAATRTAVDQANQQVEVWLEACVDPAGKIEKVSATKRTSDRGAAYAKTIEAAAARWTFRPFVRGGKKLRVCLQRRYAYPADP